MAISELTPEPRSETAVFAHAQYKFGQKAPINAEIYPFHGNLLNRQ